MVTNKDYPLTHEQFQDIYAKVPRLTVELVMQNSKGKVYLTKRAIEPCAGEWHLPGGTVFFGESLEAAVKRVGARELGITVTAIKPNGYIEYPSHYQNGLDTPVGLVFEVEKYTGECKVNEEAATGDWFSILPENTHADQDVYLTANGYLLPAAIERILGQSRGLY